MDKEWEGSLRLSVRLGIFLAAGGLALALTLVVGFADGNWRCIVDGIGARRKFHGDGFC